MRRRALILAALGAPLAALAQSGRKARIGYLLATSLVEPPTAERRAFLDGLRELGYVPGKNVEIVYQSAQNAIEFVEDLCRDLVADKVDVIVVSGAISLLAAKRCTSKVPIVFMAVGDPIGIGAVSSLSRPEGNITGVSFISSELAGKRVQLIRDLLPAARRVAVLWDSRNANARAESEATLAALSRLGAASEPYPVASDHELTAALERIQASRPDALYVTFEGGIVASNRTLIAEFGRRRRLAVVSGWDFLTEAGALVSYAPNIPAMFRRSASYVDRILKGARPSQLPIEQASSVELVINLKTAREIGVTIPQEMLIRADRVIQ
jgi:putative ABC transport system substrate-binding protein